MSAKASTMTASPKPNGGIQKRRSRRVCQHCHTRKLRCNLQDSGSPCANCAVYSVVCVLRQRKNQRANSNAGTEDIAPGHAPHQGLMYNTEESTALSGSSMALPQVDNNHRDSPMAPPPPHPPPIDNNHMETPQLFQSVESWSSTGENHSSLSTDLSPQMWWNSSMHDPNTSMNVMYGFEHLNDLEDIFAFTGATLPPEPSVNLRTAYGQQIPNLVSHASPSNVLNDRVLNLSSTERFGIPTADEEYLRSQGCFQLPPSQVLREMMLLYFRIVHPNLPIVVEDEFWALWTSGGFSLGACSLLVIRAMVYATCSLLEEETLAALGFHNKRDAVDAYYRTAKLLFDFGIERDPVANARACLLLSYQTPNDNKFRVNSSWLSHAIRFARIAKADSYYRFREDDPARSKTLKRIWWGVLFRDRIISVGVRRSLQVDFDPSWESTDGTQRLQEQHLLQADDFSTELGQSPVHGLDTQLRIVEMINCTCRLVHCLSKPLKVLYIYEGEFRPDSDMAAAASFIKSCIGLEDRLDAASRSLRSTIGDIHKSIASLRTWHDATISKFPFPVSLDDADEIHESICVYANMVFCYYSACLFALNTYLLLIYEMIPASRVFFEGDLVEECEEALEISNTDIARRMQELVQIRLVKYIPISAGPIIGPPLALQAINVAASRGTRLEAVERRKLDVFTRTLQSMQERFDGTDFCAELMHNIIGFASNDDTLTTSMTDWRKKCIGRSASTMPGQIKVGWNNLVHQKPRLFLRLMMHLDHAVCTGGPPQEKDFPVELRRHIV